MYTKLQQSRITYLPKDNLLNVITKHQSGLRLIKFGRTASAVTTKGEYEVKTLADVIIGWANGERTVFVDDNTVQCSAYRQRSDLDLFLLCRYYFSMSYKEFFKLFYRLKNMSKSTPYGKYNLLCAGYCGTIKRRVYHAITENNKVIIKNNFKHVKLKVNKTPNIGETL